MVNRTGQGAPIPLFQGGKASFSPMESINYGTTSPSSTSNPFQSIAQAIQGVSSHIEDRLDLQAKIEGAKSGTLAGQNGVPNLQDEMTLRGQAFNMAARDAVETQFNLMGIKNISELEDAHKADPQGFEEKAKSYLDGISQKLSEFDPEIANKLKADYEVRSLSALSRIKSTARAMARDRMLETESVYQDNLKNDIQKTSANIFKPNTPQIGRAHV